VPEQDTEERGHWRCKDRGLGAMTGALVVGAVATGRASPARQKLEERGPVVVVDNYDSFTYNLCQVNDLLSCSNFYAHHRTPPSHSNTTPCLR